MLSESVLKIDVCRYLEENWPLDDEHLERYTNSTDLWHTSDVLAGFSRFWRRKTGGLFLLVFMLKYVNASLLQMAFIHILNTQKYQKGIVYVCLSFFILTIQYRLVWLCIKLICFSIDDTYGSKFHAAHIDMVHTYLFMWKQISIKLTRFNFTCCRDKQASIFTIQGNYMLPIVHEAPFGFRYMYICILCTKCSFFYSRLVRFAILHLH